jgi:hypothetical protein
MCQQSLRPHIATQQKLKIILAFIAAIVESESYFRLIHKAAVGKIKLMPQNASIQLLSFKIEQKMNKRVLAPMTTTTGSQKSIASWGA